MLLGSWLIYVYFTIFLVEDILVTHHHVILNQNFTSMMNPVSLPCLTSTQLLHNCFSFDTQLPTTCKTYTSIIVLKVVLLFKRLPPWSTIFFPASPRTQLDCDLCHSVVCFSICIAAPMNDFSIIQFFNWQCVLW